MNKLDPTMAEKVAEAISVFQEKRTGYPPKAVTVVLSDDTLVVTLHEALSPAEKALVVELEGQTKANAEIAAQLDQFERHFFRPPDFLDGWQDVHETTAVRQALMLQGVAGSQISTLSYGEERPAVQGQGEFAWSKNRRVEIAYSE